jgi:hypothetical protein
MRHIVIRSEHDHQRTRTPVCPHCGAELEDMRDYLIRTEPRSQTVSDICDACSKPMTIQVNYSVTFTTEP